MPFLTGKNEGRPHETLFWRRDNNMAVRHLDWKLLKQGDGGNMLFDLKSDRSEANNVAAANSDLVKELREKYDRWSSELMEPRWRKIRPKYPDLGGGISGPKGIGPRDSEGTDKKSGKKKEGAKDDPKKGGAGGGAKEDSDS